MDILFDNHWIQIRKKEYYVYAHLKWCNGVGVAVLPYRKHASGRMEYLGRYVLLMNWRKRPAIWRPPVTCLIWALFT